MLRAIRAVRPASRALSASKRSISSTVCRLSDDHHASAPQIYGSGLKSKDAIPTDEEQATGLERYQLLGRMEGVDVFDMVPLDSSRLGTLAEPVKVPSLFPERLVGCTGVPADSHETLWFTLDTNKNRRCPECGSVYALDYQGNAAEAHHH